ncbi:hypothetical protein [Streptomyces sp. NPDC056491]|uniref:hypothetical protein n=1 Tax=Streptomyces sp. NPDC056491 TaxID=3345837 RepID=UPI0036751478
MHEVHRRWGIPAEEIVRILRTAVSMDGKMNDEDRTASFPILAPPAADRLTRPARTAGPGATFNSSGPCPRRYPEAGGRSSDLRHDRLGQEHLGQEHLGAGDDVGDASVG